MRVTNGELENAKTALIYVGETNGSLSAGNKRLFDYISDLLEARELIKEMRNYFSIVRDNSLNPAHTMTQLGLEETTDANHKIALMMLEKSKEYAE